ncbi:MAG: transglutaminase family protein [Clostridiaceae bacterium]
MFNIESNDINKYLEKSEIIDFDNSEIISISNKLSVGISNEIDLVKRVYEFVRDEVNHSADISGKIVTFKASDVLKYRQGVCYAKSHLLAAILRSLNIPTGFCYQGLIMEDEKETFIVIHGFNGIYLKSQEKWIRVDARGNKKGINAQFSIKDEKLAYDLRKELGEYDDKIIYFKPNINVLNKLRSYSLFEDLRKDYPTALY